MTSFYTNRSAKNRVQSSMYGTLVYIEQVLTDKNLMIHCLTPSIIVYRERERET